MSWLSSSDPRDPTSWMGHRRKQSHYSRVGVGGILRDGPGRWLMPATAAEYLALGEIAPTRKYPCSELSGNLVNTIGTSLPLVPVGSGHLYGVQLEGWLRRFVGLDGTTVGQAFQALHTVAANVSVAVTGHVYVADQPAGTPNTSRVMGFGLTNGLAITNANATPVAGALRPIINNASSTTPPNGHGTARETGSVRQFALFRNATTDRSGAVSNQSSSRTTHSELALTNDILAIGPAAAVVPPLMLICDLDVYIGAGAEQDFAQVFANRRWAA